MTSKIKFIEKSHKYILGKKELTSVTTLLKRHGLATDFSEVMISPSVLAEARDRGVKIHKEVSDWVIDNTEPTTDEAIIIVDYLNITPTDELQSEYIVHNGEIAGIVDLSDGTDRIIDIKTGRKLDIVACSWQLSIYEYLENKTYKYLQIFHFPKNANDFKLVEVPRIPRKEIEKLLECERNCEIYQSKTVELATVSKEISDKIVLALETIERLEKVVQTYREAVLIEMQDKNIKKFDNGKISITYIEPTTRLSVDSKKLKEELPEVYNNYSKISEVKASVKIIKKELKNGNENTKRIKKSS